MSRELTNKDYITILKFYKMNIPKSKRILKKKAEQIMGEKLCRCIKKLEPVYQAKSIAICTKSIFNNKGVSRGTWTCKKNPTAKITQQKKNSTRKSKR